MQAHEAFRVWRGLLTSVAAPSDCRSMLPFPSPPHPSSSPIYPVHSSYEPLVAANTHIPYNLAESLAPAASLPHGVLTWLLKFSIQGLSPSSRYLTLRRAALVCLSWRNPALELLGRDIVIRSQGTAIRWLEAPASVLYPTERLEIVGQVNDIAAEVVIGHTRGCRRLRVDFVRGLSNRVFSSLNLAGPSRSPLPVLSILMLLTQDSSTLRCTAKSGSTPLPSISPSNSRV